MLKRQHLALPVLMLLAVCAAYANHFHNGFHFDDFHTIVDNPYIRSLRNVPRFFTDTTTFSVLPTNRTYRPIVSTSLAFDYWLGHSYNVFWFHLSTFILFLVLLLATLWFFMAVLKSVRPQQPTRNLYIATFATAWYGLHPAIAETVNYIIQRGDLYSTLGVVAALAMYAQLPRLRRTGIYLLPLAFGLLSKPPALVLPILLFLYIWFFEEDANPSPANPSRTNPSPAKSAALRCLPSVILTGSLLWLQAAMTPKTYVPAVISTFDYRITQPYVWLRYFGSFFLPMHLSADTDLQAFNFINAQALLGFLFAAALIAAAYFTARKRQLRPVSYGLLWFLITSLPTSIYRLSEVENDHRMFLPFVGLVLAVTWSLALAVECLAAAPRISTWLKPALWTASLLLLTGYAWGTHVRNQVWLNEDTLWLDVTQKSPHNGRGLMIYGLALMGKGRYPEALDYYQRALIYTPNYPTLEINLGVLSSAMGNSAEAERHFQRAIALAPDDDLTHFYFGRWLFAAGRDAEAITQLKTAVDLNPARLDARILLMQAYAANGDRDAALGVAHTTLQLDPTNAAAASFIAHPGPQTVDDWINLSLHQYQQQKYRECIASAERALQLKPNTPEAYNNIAAAYEAMGNWNEAITAANEAIQLKPDFQLAKNNLAWSLQQKQKTQH